MEYQIIRSRRRRKTTTIKITRSREVVVMAPVWADDREIAKLVSEREGWIEKQLEKLATHPRPIRKRFVDGEGFSFLGKSYPLRIKRWKGSCTPLACPQENGAPRGRSYKYNTLRLELKGKQFVINIHQNIPDEKREKELRKIFTQWYIDYGTPKITDIATGYAETLGLQFNRVKLKRVRSTWGSCSAKNNLNFNWKIVLAPLPIIHYLVIHEVCHLRHRHHQPTFWKLVSRLDPDYKEHQTWLKQNWWRLSI